MRSSQTVYDQDPEPRGYDPRLTEAILHFLVNAKAKRVANIGAGAGALSRILADQGFQVIAIESSKSRPHLKPEQSKAPTHPIQWITAHVENLPLRDHAVDAALIVQTFHQFRHEEQALREITRITGGSSIIILTYDPEMMSGFWLAKYFPNLVPYIQATYRPIPQLMNELRDISEHRTKVKAFEIPADFVDSFVAAGWSTPEQYLDRAFRQKIQAFKAMESERLNLGLSRLKKDLKTGIWDQMYGELRTQAFFDIGFRFVYTLP